MKQFLDKDFLLNTEAARKLYHEAAEKQPIIDYHCHLNPREIWEDIRYENITRVWLGGDHYKWRLMRSAAGYSAHPDWLKLVNHASGHRPPPSASEAGYRFLDRFLKLEDGRR